MTRVLLAFDRSDPSDAALRAVVRQFDPAVTEVLVVHVVTWFESVPAALTFAEGPSAADDILTHERSARRHGEEIAASAVRALQAAGFRASAHVTDGDPADAILMEAGDWHPDVIVAGSHQRRGLERLLLGSVSGPLTRRAPCAVQIVPLQDEAAERTATAPVPKPELTESTETSEATETTQGTEGEVRNRLARPRG
jgi:nucleotide-binding universal stress UspA family protein